MLSFTSFIDKEVLDACPNIRYIGICASLYAPENANVDIRHAEKKGIVVTGVRDYGDEGVKNTRSANWFVYYKDVDQRCGKMNLWN